MDPAQSLFAPDGAIGGYFSPPSPLAIVPAAYRLWTADATQAILAVLGTLFIGIAISRLLLNAWNYIKPSTLPVFCHSQTGSWALVTGASDGIGREFSEELLRRGFNVLLHGRNADKLERIRGELAQQNPKRSVDVVVVDASVYDEGYNTILTKVNALPGKLTILVNNVGGAITRPQYVAVSEISHEAIDTTINVNARFPTHLTRALLPTLRKNTPSLVFNCGSTGGLLGTPYLSTYSSAKAYIHAFSLSLQNEMVAEKIEGVHVVGALIGNVFTAGNPRNMPFFTLSPRDCAVSCLNQVGNPSPLVWVNWRHAFQFWCGGLLPRKIIQTYAAAEMRERAELEKKGG